jgi:ribose transport system substrate-binding protein
MREVIRGGSRLVCALLIVGLVAVGAAACGGGSDSSSSGSSTSSPEEATTTSSNDSGVSAQAESTYGKFAEPVTTFVGGPTEPVKPPTGKKLTIVTCSFQGVTCVRAAEGAKSAAETLGYSAKIVDGQGNPAVWNSAILTAVSEKADGIILTAVSAPLVTGAIAAANKADIPVAATLDTEGEGLAVKANTVRSEVVSANSAYVAKESGASAKVLLISDVSEFPDLKQDEELWPKELEADCNGGCEVADKLEFTLETAAQRLPGDVAQALQSNPEIKYIALPFDTIIPFVEQGMRQAGKNGQVKMIGANADPPSIKSIEAGEMQMSLGAPAEWIGWDAVDGLVRVMAGKELPPLEKGVTNYKVPMRYVDESDNPGPQGWTGEYDYEAAFKKLWGK